MTSQSLVNTLHIDCGCFKQHVADLTIPQKLWDCAQESKVTYVQHPLKDRKHTIMCRNDG